MLERFREQGQQPAFPELTPDPRVVDVLRGTVSDPIQTISHKPGSEGQLVTIRLALEEPGMFGLEDWEDNKEWAGINNHTWLSTRYGVHFSRRMAQVGHETDPQRILNGMIVSHAGRRQSDEARWYPDAIKDSVAKLAVSNETLGMRLIQGKVPQDAFELVVALGHNVEGFSVDPAIFKTWDYRLAIYADHRTTQKYEPLNTRMGDFLLGNFFQQSERTPEKKEQVYGVIGNIIDAQKNYRLGQEGAEAVTLDEANQIAESLGARADSERLTRRELMRIILQDADTEAALIQAGINPNAINDETVPMPKWEDNLRKEYVVAAKESIIDGVYGYMNRFLDSLRIDGDFDYSILNELNLQFPLNSWWGQYARTTFYEWHDAIEQRKKIDILLLGYFKRPS